MEESESAKKIKFHSKKRLIKAKCDYCLLLRNNREQFSI